VILASADMQLFLHVLGAITLFGATAAVTVLAFFGRNREEQLPLARASFFTLLVLAVPAWVVTLAFGYWTKSSENWPDDIGWIGLGAGIADAGLLALLAAGALSYAWMRRPVRGWPVTALGTITGLYLVALAVAWWVMTAKVPT
jgi:hypothetical protein